MLATIQDVKRWLRALDQDIDEEIRPLLQSSDEWFRRYLHQDYAVGTVTDVFTDKLEGSVLTLTNPDPQGVQIKAFYFANDPNPAILTEDADFQVLETGNIRLFFTGVTTDMQIGGTGAVVRLLPRSIDRLEVTYTTPGTVPYTVREAVAMDAAAAYTRGPGVIAGITSERIGDYSYSSALGGPTSSDGVLLAAIDKVRGLRKVRVRSV